MALAARKVNRQRPAVVCHWRTKLELNQEIQNSRRHLIAQIRMPVQQTGNIGEILLTFAATPSVIRYSPNLPLKHVLNTRNRKSYAQVRFVERHVQEN